jgi:hypothetical protein
MHGHMNVKLVVVIKSSVTVVVVDWWRSSL